MTTCRRPSEESIPVNGGGVWSPRPTKRPMTHHPVGAGVPDGPPVGTSCPSVGADAHIGPPDIPRPHIKLPVIAKPVRTLAVGSEPSAASGRRSEVSEWPRSKFQVSAVRQRRNFGHRNRDIRSPVPSAPLPKGGWVPTGGAEPLPYAPLVTLP